MFSLSNIVGTAANSFAENMQSYLATVGKAGLHTLLPDDFEYYMVSLELLDSSKVTKAFLNFVVMPNNIMETKTQIASIQKTQFGSYVTFNPSFNFRDISIQGSFGKKFRLISDSFTPKEYGIDFFNMISGVNFNGDNSRSRTIKTGYGLVKMLQKIVNMSQSLDDKGKPYILIFSNYALNTRYVVEVMQDSYSQSLENNMIWNYALEMKAIAPIDVIYSDDEKTDSKYFLTTVSSQAISKGIQNIIMDTAKSLTNGLNLAL